MRKSAPLRLPEPFGPYVSELAALNLEEQIEGYYMASGLLDGTDRVERIQQMHVDIAAKRTVFTRYLRALAGLPCGSKIVPKEIEHQAGLSEGEFVQFGEAIKQATHTLQALGRIRSDGAFMLERGVMLQF